MTSQHSEVARPNVAIILVNWNSWPDVVECIDSVFGQPYANFHIFVVDNDSGDGSVEQIAAWCAQPTADSGWRRQEGVKRYTDSAANEPIACRVASGPDTAITEMQCECKLTVVRSGANRGFAGGCNVGMRAASDSFQFFWLLNTDTVVDQHALARLVERALQDPNVGMVGSTLRYYDKPHFVQALGGARFDSAKAFSCLIGQGAHKDSVAMSAADVEKSMSYVMGASMFVSKPFVQEIGLMQEDYFLYYEEFDWAMRSRGKFKLGYAAQSLVFHKSGASSSKVIPLVSANYYYRNRIRFFSRFFPQHMGAVKLSLLREMCYFALKRRWSHVRLIAAILRAANNLALEARRSNPWNGFLPHPAAPPP